MTIGLSLLTLYKQQKQSGEIPQGNNLDDMTNYMIFNPLLLSAESQDLEMIALLLFGAKLSKTPEGLGIIKDLAIKYMDTVGKIISNLEKSSASNWLTACVNQMLCAKVMRRMGIITSSDLATYQSTLNWIIGGMIVKDAITDTLSGLTSFALGGGIRGVTGAVSTASK
jgi:hypothetical protein